jgi:hypothetical protein
MKIHNINMFTQGKKNRLLEVSKNSVNINYTFKEYSKTKTNKYLKLIMDFDRFSEILQLESITNLA